MPTHDWSQADLSLCCLLAFWFNRNPVAIDRVFRSSKLMREKWDEARGETTYGAMTIAKACAQCEQVYSPTRTNVRQGHPMASDISVIGASPNGDISDDSEMHLGPSGRKYKISGPLVINDTEIEEEDVEWLWDGYLPRGFIALISGHTGMGKTFVIADVAARLGRGEYGSKGRTLIMSEARVQSVLKPRLRAQNAPAGCVSFMTVDALAAFTIGDIVMLEDAWNEANCPELVVIDPPTSFLGGQDEDKNEVVRRLLKALDAWTAKTHVALVLIQHLNKGSKGDVLAALRTIGSIAWSTASSINFVIGRDPNDPETRILACSKCNIGAVPPSRSFKIPPNGRDTTLIWTGESSLSAEEVLAPSQNGDVPKAEKAAEWLTFYLGEQPRNSNDVFRAGKVMGFGEGTIYKAKDLIGVKPQKEGFGRAGFVWALPPR